MEAQMLRAPECYHIALANSLHSVTQSIHVLGDSVHSG